MSNRSLRNNRRRRYAARQRGGGLQDFGVGNLNALAGSFAGASTTGAGSGPMVPLEVKADAQTGCDAIPRTETALHTQANPDIAGTNVFPFPGGFTSPSFTPSGPMSNAVQFPSSDINARQMGGARRPTSKTHRHGRGQTCPVCKKRKQRGGGCGCMQRGGGSPQGLAQFPDALYLSGGGPNVGNPVNVQSGCDARAGSLGDPHAPINHMQRGGAYMSISSAAPLDAAYSSTPPPSYGTANAFPESCYKAPGSEVPVYNNNSTAFNFSPNLVENNSMVPGVVAYMNVNQQPGRMGAPDQRGGRRDTRKNRKNRKNRKGSRKGSRKGNRKSRN
jgi:hypothetical protein